PIGNLHSLLSGAGAAPRDASNPGAQAVGAGMAAVVDASGGNGRGAGGVSGGDLIAAHDAAVPAVGEPREITRGVTGDLAAARARRTAAAGAGSGGAGGPGDDAPARALLSPAARGAVERLADRIGLDR